jgi:soluble lytic murein transglycosylase-like protein
MGFGNAGKALKKSSFRKGKINWKSTRQASSHVLKKTSGKRKIALRSPRNSLKRTRTAVASAAVDGRVVGLIKAMAPGHGVPTWFALRIAKVESNYRPHLRGLAGEYGVFQLKCATAKGIGYRGNCSGLLDPRTNVRYGLRHLALAMKSSRGNLRLAASKHNGGLGRKTMVAGYVAKVF